MIKTMLYVVLPCYNEEDNIAELISLWKAEENELNEKGIKLNILIVNDGSKDRTLDIVKYQQELDRSIIILDHGINKGLGEAVNSGINYVLSKEDNSLLCLMDADMTHEPKYIYSMLEKMNKDKLDCVIASRYRKGSKVEGLSMFRKALSLGARFTYTLRLRIPKVRDYTCGYRLYKTSTLKVINNRYNGKVVSESGFACMMELLAKIHLEGFKIGEVPFVLKYHLKGGQSKMKVGRTILKSMLLLARI